MSAEHVPHFDSGSGQHAAPEAEWQIACRQRLHQVLPAQAPIRDFVHHNTLHGFEHLPFAQALTQARQRLGATPWRNEAESRADHACGRIDASDLEAALVEAAPANGCLHPAWPHISRHALFDASLRLGPPDRGRAPGPTSGLQAACAALLQSSAMATDQTPTSVGFSAHDRWQPAPATWPELLTRMGTHLTWSALLERLTGVDLRPTIEAHLLPLLSHALDPHASVAASWPQWLRRSDDNATGFYAWWRQCALVDWGWGLGELQQARSALAGLPDDPVFAACAELGRWGTASARWPDHLEALALELPGWSGMVLQCEHPARPAPAVEAASPASPTAPAVALFDYLAVRLVLERLFAEDLVRRTWGLPLQLNALGDHFQAHPDELALRLAFHAGDLPETLALDVDRLTQCSPEQNTPAAWQRVAAAVQRTQLAGAAQRAATALHQRSDRLAQLASLLGLDEAALQHGGPAGLAALEQADHALDPDQRGYLWLLAYERHYHQQVFTALLSMPAPTSAPRPADLAQLVFCMDDREEGSRRHLEETLPGISTYGAAGFFGLPFWWQGLDDTRFSALCPVVHTPAHLVREVCAETLADASSASQHQRQRRKLWWQRLTDHWPQFTLRPGPLTPLLVVAGAPLALIGLCAELLAPATHARRWQTWWQGWLGTPRTRIEVSAVSPPDGHEQRLTWNKHGVDVSSSAGDHRPCSLAAGDGQTAPAPPSGASSPAGEACGRLQAGFTDSEAARRVLAFLTSIGLTTGFAPLVVIVGHGSSSRNNPHRSAYDCGACSGRHGGPNARAIASLANHPPVRQLLAAAGLHLPEQTWFLGAEHHTGDETVHWYDLDLLPEQLAAPFAQLDAGLRTALGKHAVERCRTLASAPSDPTPEQALLHLAGRCLNPGEARPELGHATVAVACIGRRAMTRGLFLDRRAFLISYDPDHDSDGRQLEALLLAAGPVGAGISLEYYFSRVDNERLGCGSKVTHNLAGELGVMSGPCADLRTGLPLQMIEVHEPMRLLLVVEQTPATLAAILERQPALQQLIGNGWVLLAAKTPGQRCLHRYLPEAAADTRWQMIAPPDERTSALPDVGCSRDWFAGKHDRLSPARIVTGVTGVAGDGRQASKAIS